MPEAACKEKWLKNTGILTFCCLKAVEVAEKRNKAAAATVCPRKIRNRCFKRKKTCVKEINTRLKLKP